MSRSDSDQWTPDPVAGYRAPASLEPHNHSQSEIIGVGVPVGAITAYWGVAAPSGWLVCDGAAIPSQYASLIALVGSNTPNLKGKVVVGVDAAQTEFDTLGETGGAKTHTLTTAELASHGHTQNAHSHGADDNHIGGHSHTVNSHNHGGGTGVHAHTVNGAWVDGAALDVGGTNRMRYAVGANSNTPGTSSDGVANSFETPGTNSGGDHNHDITVNNATATNQTAGSDTAHNNLQPYVALTYIIKAA